MALERFLREFLLAILLAMGLVSLQTFAAEIKQPAASAQDSVLIKEKTYFDVFRESVELEIQKQLARKMNVAPGDFQVSLENIRVTPALPVLKKYPVQILGLGSEGSKRLDGLSSLTISIGESRESVELSLTGVLKITGPVIVAKENLVRGRLLNRNDFRIEKLPWKTLPGDSAGTALQDLEGRRVKTLISEGAIVWKGLLEENLAVRQGDPVQVTVYSGPGVIIRSRGIARQEGRMGEFIRVEQNDTRKTLNAVVVGEKNVEVRL